MITIRLMLELDWFQNKTDINTLDWYQYWTDIWNFGNLHISKAKREWEKFLSSDSEDFRENFSEILNVRIKHHAMLLLGDWFPRKNSRRHNSIYNIYWLLTRFKFVRLLAQLFPSNLEVHLTSALSWPANNINTDVYLQRINT